jgi:serine/threonine protein kinase
MWRSFRPGRPVMPSPEPNRRPGTATVRVPLGTQVGAWRVQRYIASGGWGSVYEGVLLESRRGVAAGVPRQVALKVLPTGSATPRLAAMLAETLHREVTSRAALEHPRLVRLLDVVLLSTPDQPELDGATVLVLELAQGSLADRLDHHPGPWPLPDATERLAEIAEGMQYIHESGWVHGDLKPSNVLLRSDGSCCLTDFGLAGILDGTHAYVPPIGTSDYAAPEQRETFAGTDGHQMRPSGDVWAFGVIAWRVLTGEMPFPGQSPSSRADSAGQFARGDRPLRAPTGLAAHWSSLLMDCLVPQAKARPSAAEVVDRIRHPGGHSRRRRVRRWALGAAAAAILVPVTWVAVDQTRRDAPTDAARAGSTASSRSTGPTSGPESTSTAPTSTAPTSTAPTPCQLNGATANDPNSNESFPEYVCQSLPSPLYASADGQLVVAQLTSRKSWFACYRRGARTPAGGDIWYYTQGDKVVPAYRGRHSWGFVPADVVLATSHPILGMVSCPATVG